MNYSSEKKTALGTTNTQSGKEIKPSDFTPNYTGRWVELSTSKPNLLDAAEELAYIFQLAADFGKAVQS